MLDAAQHFVVCGIVEVIFEAYNFVLRHLKVYLCKCI